MARKPLLMDKLSEAKQVALAGLVNHPGYPALEELLMASCDEVNKALLKLDPGEEGYLQKVAALQAKAKERNEFCLLILESIQWHKQVADDSTEEETPQTNPIVKGYKQ